MLDKIFRRDSDEARRLAKFAKGGKTGEPAKASGRGSRKVP